jgi:NADH-quinone oxidoreductase subunit M
LPALSGFVSEIFVFMGAFQVHQVITILSTLGIVLTAAYMLWTLQRMFLGVVPEKWSAMPDINGRELVTLVPLAAIVIFLGIYPGPVINLMTSSVNALVAFVHTAGQDMVQATSTVR